jgi:hypothetical protein
MKNVTVLFLVALLVVAPAVFARDHHVHYSSSGHHSDFLDGVDLDIRHHSIFLTNDEYDNDEVEITRDYELYINDDRIELSEKQEKLVHAFYDQTFELMDSAKAIGLEGARVGMAGAKVGLKAVLGLAKLFSPNYDTDDLEADIDREASKIEARAEELEDRADQIEDMAYDVEDRFDRMMDGIPALRDLNWSYDLTISPRVGSHIRASVSPPAAPAAPPAPAAPAAPAPPAAPNGFDSRTSELPE